MSQLARKPAMLQLTQNVKVTIKTKAETLQKAEED